MTLAQFTTKIKNLMKTNFLHKRASSPVMANAKVPVTFEDGNNKTYFDSTVTGADLQKLAGSASMSDTIPNAISAISSRVHKIDETLRFDAVEGWQYTGVAITIPANCVYTISADTLFHSATPRGVAIASSNSTMDWQTRVITEYSSSFPNRATLSGVTPANSSITLYLWSEYNSSGQGIISGEGFYIQL